MTPTMEEVAGWLRDAAFHVVDLADECLMDEAAVVQADCNDRAAQVEAMGWRPIEEAPKDGTLIDLWEADTEERLPDCMWCRGTWRQFQHPDEEWVDVMYGMVTHFVLPPQPPVKK